MRLMFVSFMPNILQSVITIWNGLSQNLRKRLWPTWSPSSSNSMAIHWLSLSSGLIKFFWQSTYHVLSRAILLTCQRTMMCIRTSIKGWPMFEEMLRYFSLQLGVELNGKVLEQFFIIFIQENFYFSPESLIESCSNRLLCKKIDNSH